MARVVLPTILLGAAACLLIGPWAHAECSDSQIIKLYRKNISIAKIADRCEMRRDDIEAVIAEYESPEGQDEEGQDDDPPPPPPRQAYCCDVFGNSRCPIVTGSTAIGDGCFCPGQGYGQICR